MSMDWLRAEWPAPPGVQAGTTYRSGGRSTGAYESLNLAAHVDDDANIVNANRQQFIEHCGLPAAPSWICQVHGTRVATDPLPGEYPEADAIVSRQRQTVCAVLTADCLPVVFATSDGTEIAVAHAGWRGLLHGVLEAVVNDMQAPAAAIVAWLGPAISQPAFEVGDEVREQFVALHPASQRFFDANTNDRWQADLYGLARHRLALAGVRQVFGGGLCTFSDAEAFFSYRRDGQCGRMATFVFRGEA